jgi:pimeloyl-ACP methyl ester carboxylesterase
MAAYQSILSALPTLDLLPGVDDTGREQPGDSRPDLDTSRIYYQGTSLGGVLGLAFVSLAPRLEGAFVHVSGVGITSILSNSVLWQNTFSKLVPEAANGAEALLLRAAIQQEIDYSDAINFVHYLRTPPAGIEPKPLAVVVGRGDSIVTNSSTVALAELAQLPLVGRELFPLPGTTRSDQFVDGYGVKQFRSLLHLFKPLDNMMAHVSFIRHSMSMELAHWLEERNK